MFEDESTDEHVASDWDVDEEDTGKFETSLSAVFRVDAINSEADDDDAARAPEIAQETASFAFLLLLT